MESYKQTVRVKMVKTDQMYVDNDIEPAQVLKGDGVMEVVLTKFVAGLIHRGEVELCNKDLFAMLLDREIEPETVSVPVLCKFLGVTLTRGMTREKVLAEVRRKLDGNVPESQAATKEEVGKEQQ